MRESLTIVLCTAPSDEVAAVLARGLVEAKLAACVNVLSGVRSFYVWEGAVHDEPERQLLIKTRDALLPDVERFLTEHHPYDVPEILFLPIAGGSAKYLDWLLRSTQPT